MGIKITGTCEVCNRTSHDLAEVITSEKPKIRLLCLTCYDKEIEDIVKRTRKSANLVNPIEISDESTKLKSNLGHLITRYLASRMRIEELIEKKKEIDLMRSKEEIILIELENEIIKSTQLEKLYRIDNNRMLMVTKSFGYDKAFIKILEVEDMLK